MIAGRLTFIIWMIAGGLTFIGESRRAIKYYDNMPTPYVQMSKEVNFTEQR